ncbi:type II toxin-antitoxin system ParD family antitoxin [Pararhizobium sp.]|uniref:type II toxin-antitoxin system ParD family antitoxin n=1 Tax=Pararhizobium sp. TaxID=1977563 RepID=UPI002724F3E0|nr:type II toxin-antitoxin system ParD family antitoxin [Pararhizobium sp.]MDO9418623.1 type II toxin-antitoxin system ParD family antitoxin [Pararhizobium sp.]
MANLNIALPDAMKQWVDDQAQTGRYTDADDYIRDLIRKDQQHAARVLQLQRLVDDGLESGISNESMDDILAALQNAAE